jgi:cytochrome c-type biogenesis protein CcmH
MAEVGLGRFLFQLRAALAAALLVVTLPAGSAEAPAVAADPRQEARMMALAAELRCLVCQNQTIADSHAGLALDLRQQIREQLAAGKNEAEIRDYMTQRYGDFVLYRPPFKATTALLWLGPVLLLAVALGSLAWVLRRRQRLGDEAFDPEPVDNAGAAFDNNNDNHDPHAHVPHR